MCLYNYLATSDKTQCLIRKITDACIADDHCNFAVTNSNCTNNICLCNSGYKVNSLKTTCSRRVIGDSCSLDTDCTDAVTNSNCTNNLCYCKPGFAKNTIGTTCTLRQLGDACDLNTDCSFAVADSYCKRDPLTSAKTCRCFSGYFSVNDSKADCTLRHLGDPCSMDSDCSDAVANSVCNTTNKVCMCASGFEANDDGTICTKRIIGDTCSLDLDCYDAVTFSKCANQKCVCMTGMVTFNTLFDYQVEYPIHPYLIIYSSIS